MEGYDGWYDEEDPTTSDSTHMGVPSSSGSGGGGGAATGANRKSVVLFDDIVPGPGATAGGEVIPSGGANKDNTSRVFPGRTLAPPRATRNFAHLQEPVYKPEAKAPYIVIALVVMLGSFAMFVIGCICVSDYYVQSIGSGQGALDTCGPAGGGGGVVMIIGGCLFAIVAGYQLWRLREPVMTLTGYRPVTFGA